MKGTQDPIGRLVRALSRLPGIGEKTAMRLAFFILRSPSDVASEITEGVREVKERMHFCSVCQNLTEGDTCEICVDHKRDRKIICVVEEPIDVVAVERTGEYRGLYHVLHGALSPLDGVGPDDIRIKSLLDRLKKDGAKEVILATDPNVEGETTALYLKDLLKPFRVSVTRIASGIPVGGDLEFTDQATLARSLEARREFS